MKQYDVQTVSLLVLLQVLELWRLPYAALISSLAVLGRARIPCGDERCCIRRRQRTCTLIFSVWGSNVIFLVRVAPIGAGFCAG